MECVPPSLVATIQALPNEPGVYLFKDDAAVILYIGKAKSLHQRVKQYLRDAGDGRLQIPFLMRRATQLEVILTSNEKEALLLENTLIKQHQPIYNIDLKDDKEYLCVRLDLNAAYPRLEITRRLKKEGVRYFGPYHSAAAARKTVRLVNRYFRLRTCKDSVFKNRTRPCLQYEIKRCDAPCVFDVDKTHYRAHVQDAIDFLSGQSDNLIKTLHSRMHTHAEAEEFELAAHVRDQIEAIKASLIEQKVCFIDHINRDIFGLAYRDSQALLHVMKIRHGALRDSRQFHLAEVELPEQALLEDLLSSYYKNVHGEDIPQEILLPFECDAYTLLGKQLEERSQKHTRIHVITPIRGDKKRLINLAQKNAQHALALRLTQETDQQAVLLRLQQRLRLRQYPERIECYDISNLQGGYIVGSQVVFEKGTPAKQEYRRYRMKSVHSQDDFASLYEMLKRRFERGLEEGELPDLVVIDGGIQQLQVACTVFNDLGIEGVDLCALAKSRLLKEHQGYAGKPVIEDDTPNQDMAIIAASPERIFLPGQKNPIVFKPHEKELLLLTRIRDEAHRFAISYHRLLQRRASLKGNQPISKKRPKTP